MAPFVQAGVVDRARVAQLRPAVRLRGERPHRVSGCPAAGRTGRRPDGRRQAQPPATWPPSRVAHRRGPGRQVHRPALPQVRPVHRSGWRRPVAPPVGPGSGRRVPRAAARDGAAADAAARRRCRPTPCSSCFGQVGRAAARAARPVHRCSCCSEIAGARGGRAATRWPRPTGLAQPPMGGPPPMMQGGQPIPLVIEQPIGGLTMSTITGASMAYRRGKPPPKAGKANPRQPRAPDYLDTDQYAGHHVRVKVDGEEIGGSPFRSPQRLQPTRRTTPARRRTWPSSNERPQFAVTLQRALENNPQATLRLLQEQYAVQPEPAKSPKRTDWDGRSDRAVRLREYEQRLAALEGAAGRPGTPSGAQGAPAAVRRGLRSPRSRQPRRRSRDAWTSKGSTRRWRSRSTGRSQQAQADATSSGDEEAEDADTRRPRWPPTRARSANGAVAPESGNATSPRRGVLRRPSGSSGM